MIYEYEIILSTKTMFLFMTNNNAYPVYIAWEDNCGTTGSKKQRYQI